MSTFRNIIARRRPSVPAAGGASPKVARPETQAADPADMHDTSTPHTAIDAPRYSQDVPRWELEPPKQTMGEEALSPAPEPPTDPAATPRRNIWDVEGASGSGAKPARQTRPVSVVVPNPAAEAPAAQPSGVASGGPVTRLVSPLDGSAPEISASDAAAVPRSAPAPAVTDVDPAPSGRSGRVKTRLLGFHSDDLIPDAFAAERAPASTPSLKCPVGWVVVIEGPGRGSSFALSSGLSMIGRGSDQTIALDFGDMSISRDNHASIAYDEEENKVLVGHGGKSNIVRLNGKPLLTTEELHNADLIRIGKTTLRYVALCGPDFSWTALDADPEADHD